METYDTHLTISLGYLTQALASLQSTLTHASSVEAIVLLQLIEKTAYLKRDAEQLLSASQIDRKEGEA